MLLVIFFFLGMFLLWCQLYLGWCGSVSWMSYGLGDFTFFFLADEISLISVFMLFCCGGIALFYCYHYFGGDDWGNLLFPLMVWFLGVMGILIFSSSLILSLVFWEYLGLVSFFLILFYSNSSSLRASLITLFASRFGDVSLFMLIMWAFGWLDSSCYLLSIFFLLVVLTKSACYPFISWLLEAMRAPTPVSSLVHSSTLVAAGVWFLFRYSSICDLSCLNVLAFFSLITIIVSGVSAVVFMDLKKIVALSTCNNVSWCILFFVSGDLGLALLQLLTHGVCKCYLFMSVGDLMSHSGSSQSSVGVYFSRYSGAFLPLVQGLLVFSLCGLPFLGVYFSKHVLLSGLFYGGNILATLLYLLSLLLSYIYSVRFALLLLSSVGGISFGYSSLFVMICPLVFLGTLVNYGWLPYLGEWLSVSYAASLVVFSIQVLGCVLGVYFFYLFSGRGAWASLLAGGESIVSLFYLGFSFFSELCLLSFYRWEIYMLGSLFPGGISWRSFGVSFTLNFLVLGICFVLFFSFICC